MRILVRTSRGEEGVDAQGLATFRQNIFQTLLFAHILVEPKRHRKQKNLEINMRHSLLVKQIAVVVDATG